MTTLADVRQLVRTDLRDPAAAARWSDAELDRHIARALAELSRAIPREAAATVAIADGSREIAVSALPGFLAPEAVELPAGVVVPFRVWAGAITLETPSPPRSGRARVRYLAAHALDASGSTVPAELEAALAGGAAGHAAIARAAHAIDRLGTGEDEAARFRVWGEGRLRAFRETLRERRRARPLGLGRLVPPA